MTRDALLQMLARRPCSVYDISKGLGIHRNETVKHLEELLRRQEIDFRMSGGKMYYVSTGAARQDGD